MAAIDRRKVVVGAGAALALLKTPSFAAELEIPSLSAAAPRSEVVRAWMNEWIDAPRAPGGSLHLTRFREPIYCVTKPIGWKPNGPSEPAAVEVPVGFVTDFASIPRLFWSLLRPDGNYTYPAIIHDYLYWTQTVPRSMADEIFRLSMKDFDVSNSVIRTVYGAVRLAGWQAWSSNGKLKKSGERRILKRWPDDPTTSWYDWKTERDVFI